jgi:hypothetical protein
MSRLQNINTTDLKDAIRLGCRTMQNVFNADDDQVPFMGSCVWPTPRFGFSAHHSESHIPGRHLNALLNAADTAGIEVAESAIENHRRAAFLSYSGVLPLALNRAAPGPGKPVNFCPHNLREGFHALYALAKYRDDAHARDLAERSIAAILDLWNPDRGWDVERIRGLGLEYQACEGFVHGEARILGPLVKYYRATGYAPALELALLLKEKLVNEFYLADGTYTQERFITRHGHSVTCVLSSLAQLAELLDDLPLLLRVKAFYDNGLWQMRDAIGWSPEVTTAPGNQGRGEANNTGDILETALILGRGGFAEYYHDAERILRCHLLPSQLRDVSFIHDPPNPKNEDGLRDVANRHLGAWGFPAPYGHRFPGLTYMSFNMDIVGGVVGSLCEVCRHVVRREPSGVWVNLLFDWETDDVRVVSPYTHDTLRVTPKRPGPIWVRIPPWVKREALTVRPEAAAARHTGDYLFFAAPPVDRPIEIRFPFAEQEIVLKHAGQRIRTRLYGDAVAGMDNNGMDLTFFEQCNRAAEERN